MEVVREQSQISSQKGIGEVRKNLVKMEGKGGVYSNEKAGGRLLVMANGGWEEGVGKGKKVAKGEKGGGGGGGGGGWRAMRSV
jgi:hypothetical protein